MNKEELLQKAIDKLKRYSGNQINIMEVCGTHTMSIFKHGIKGILPKNINLISGPGCPVCVTSQSFLDNAIKLAYLEDTIILTFGDMMKVPGSVATLEEMRARGKNIRIVYSPLDSIKICNDNPQKKVIFLAVGFETTSPVIAMTIKKAKELNINNFFILCGLKTIIPALKLISQDVELKIDGFLLPGHVSTIIGQSHYSFLSQQYSKACVISGFEFDEIIFALNMILKQNISNNMIVENAYLKAVTYEGNMIAYKCIYDVFESVDSIWRGIGKIPGSGLKLKDEYKNFDAGNIINLIEEHETITKGCICGDVIKGKKNPYQCKSFGTRCTPLNPIGSCMVSSEGTCAAYYKYGDESLRGEVSQKQL